MKIFLTQANANKVSALADKGASVLLCRSDKVAKGFLTKCIDLTGREYIEFVHNATGIFEGWAPSSLVDRYPTSSFFCLYKDLQELIKWQPVELERDKYYIETLDKINIGVC